MHQLDVSVAANRVIGNALRTPADVVGDDVFLMMDERRLTFAEVNATANSYAAGMARLGVRTGDRVSVLMANSLEFALVALAANKLGATWVPVNTTYRDAWLRDTLADADAGHRRRAGVPAVRRVGLGRGRGAGRHGELRGHLSGDVDVRHHRSLQGRPAEPQRLVHGAEVFRQVRRTREGDVLYCCVPMFNSGGWVFNVFQALIDGLPLGIDRQFSVRGFWDRTRHYGATQVTTLGAMHIYLGQAEPRPDDADNPVRCAGFVPIPHELVGPMKERFGLEAIWQGYGQSEVMPATIAYPGRSWKPNSAGSVRPDLSLALLDADDSEVPVGEVGEICVRPTRPGAIFNGYFNQPERTLEAFSNLWYHTGDLGRLDSDGELFFVDRKRDVMRHKGRNIASIDVERTARTHPGVQEVATHGITSAELRYEEEVKICVVLAEGLELLPEDLATHIMDNAPYYLVPRYIEFVDQLPLTPTGRVQKFKLRERGVTPSTWDRDSAGFIVRR